MRYKREILHNGLKLITITGLATKAVTIQAFIRAGFRFEPAEKAGLSHFVEHMMFSGTKSFPSYREEAEAVEKYGGWHMAYTWIEEQKHLVHIPIDYFNEGVDVLLESIFAPLIKKSEIEKERGVIREEILKNKADPSMSIWNYVWFPLFFQRTHLGRPYYGSIDGVKKISKKDVYDFLKENFVPQNVILFIAGDIDRDYVKVVVSKKLDNLLSKNSSNQNFTFTPVRIVNKKRHFIHVDPSYYKTSIMIGVQTVPFHHPDKHTLNILREVLGGYFGASLVRRLRDEGGLIYAWEAFHDNIADTGYLVFNASTAHENVNKVVKIVLEEFRRLSRGDFEKKEIEIARGHLIGNILANTEKGQDYIEWYGMQELLNPDNVLSIEEQIEIYKKITEGEIKRVAAKYLGRENILIGVLGKGGNDIDF